MPQTPLGWSVHGAKRWIHLGGLSFQPSELVKVFWMLEVVSFVMRSHFEVQKDLWASRWLWARLLLLIILLLIQPDFGTAFLLTTLTLGVLFVARVRMDFYFYMIFMACLGLGFVMIGAPYRWRRLMAYWDPWQFAQDQSYQLIQSLIAVGSGGLYGEGLGKSVQKHGFLPEAHTDFIFSILAEETGFIGVCLFLGLVYFFLKQFFDRARELAIKECYHESYFTLAVALLLFIQSALNIGVCLGLLPTKGLTLPLISYGGSSLWIVFFMVGLVDGCWKRCRG
jgi:cell division protein FtsW